MRAYLVHHEDQSLEDGIAYAEDAWDLCCEDVRKLVDEGKTMIIVPAEFADSEALDAEWTDNVRKDN
ncbi:MAG: hypothetical protein EOO77_32180 [Oxalobacteraceae bacterium]|jgi:hypothetical protein|nr:MAG: hypothetical protein EOO77_32180 [Oxalobacteraceae bacterium]